MDRSPPSSAVSALIQRARAAQAQVDGYSQEQADMLALAAGWAIMEPARNRALAELAVRDTGLGNVDDKVTKNHRKTLGLLRDLRNAKTVGVIAEDAATGIVEIARPVGVVAAVTPSTNPGATPANKIINAVKCRNAIIIAPSPKGQSTAALLIDFVRAEFATIGAPADLVQVLPAPVMREMTHALMREADLVVATGSQANVRAAYTSGTPAFGVGAGNVATIVDADADLERAAALIARSKTFDNATSCSSENSVIIVDAVYDATLPRSSARAGCASPRRRKRSCSGRCGLRANCRRRSPRNPRRRLRRLPDCNAPGSRARVSCWSKKPAPATIFRSPARSSRRCSPSIARGTSPPRANRCGRSTRIRAPAIRSAITAPAMRTSSTWACTCRSRG
jgi:acyl-CoA reductase-like NAD-dependent aldehyde dehydrogenase